MLPTMIGPSIDGLVVFSVAIYVRGHPVLFVDVLIQPDFA